MINRINFRLKLLLWLYFLVNLLLFIYLVSWLPKLLNDAHLGEISLLLLVVFYLQWGYSIIGTWVLIVDLNVANCLWRRNITFLFFLNVLIERNLFWNKHFIGKKHFLIDVFWYKRTNFALGLNIVLKFYWFFFCLGFIFLFDTIWLKWIWNKYFFGCCSFIFIWRLLILFT